MEAFGVGTEVASLGLSLYVLAYGLGPLLFSPLSEIPAIGRNPPYMFSFGIFVSRSDEKEHNLRNTDRSSVN